MSKSYIKESPRWLIATHQIEEAEKVLKEIAIENKIPNAEKTIFIQKLEVSFDINLIIISGLKILINFLN